MFETTELRIGHQTFQLQEANKLLNELGYMGRCHKSNGILQYSTEYPPEQIVDSVLHECLHAVWYLHLDMEEATEEHAVTMLAHGLTQMMRDNPEFFEEIQEMLKEGE